MMNPDFRYTFQSWVLYLGEESFKGCFESAFWKVRPTFIPGALSTRRHLIIAWRCVCRNHKMTMCLSKSHEGFHATDASRVKERATRSLSLMMIEWWCASRNHKMMAWWLRDEDCVRRRATHSRVKGLALQDGRAMLAC
jgi:hypothetical protein